MSNKSSFKFSKYRGLFNKWILFIFDSCMFTFANIAIWYIACGGNLAGSNYASTIFNSFYLKKLLLNFNRTYFLSTDINQFFLSAY